MAKIASRCLQVTHSKLSLVCQQWSRGERQLTASTLPAVQVDVVVVIIVVVIEMLHIKYLFLRQSQDAVGPNSYSRHWEDKVTCDARTAELRELSLPGHLSERVGLTQTDDRIIIMASNRE